MYINEVGYYLPEEIIPNSYFKDVNGLTEDWIIARTGIKTRRKAGEDENSNTMALEAVKNVFEKYNGQTDDIDIIVSGTYAPYDTVVTSGHYVQQKLNIKDCIVTSANTACSSFINALEIVEGYFALNKASKALVINSEHNTMYSHEEDDKSGHLWGDGASAVIITKDRQSEDNVQIIDIKTRGVAFEGKGPDGVYLRPKTEGLIMPFGKDVFINACNYMREVAVEILEKNNLSLNDLSYLIPHQANIRIINNVAENLKLNKEQVIVNIDKYGNTGSASTVIGLAENLHKFEKGDNIVFSVFGGGYSSGAALMKK
jgi:3-oxoacyl-[acyl-carrier-protein] synthase-3